MRIGYATSKDGIHWEKYPGNPVLDLGEPGSWDSEHVANPTVLYDGSIYKMWYTGCNKNMQIGYATSKDGIHWEKYQGNPVIDLGAWLTCPQSDIWSPSVVFDGVEYKMWYTSFDDHMRIGYATSLDGIHWSKYTSAPVLDLGISGTWDDRGVWAPCVIFHNSEYKMWYTGWNGDSVRIGFALSRDGINWVKRFPIPALETGTTGEWDYHYVSTPAVIFDGTNYRMWYSGCTFDEKYKIGYAIGAIRPDIRLSEYSHNFDDTAIGSYSDWIFTIFNDGAADLMIHSISSDDPAFAVSELSLPQNIQPQGKLDITVRFLRTEEKSYNGYITIICNDRDEPEIRIPLWMGTKLRYIRQIPRDFTGFKKDLYYGMKGEDIRYLQVILIEEGPEIYPESKVTGIYDEQTCKAVKEFQRKYRISEQSSGGVGAETRNKLNELLEKYRRETYDRVSMIFDTVNGFYKQFLPNNFPIELIFAIASQETGIYYNFNNELMEVKENGHKDNTGRGIMQITTSDFVGAGSNIMDNNVWQCRYLTSKESCYNYYSNTLHGVEANIKDALYALKVKYDMSSNCKGNKELGITDEEMRWISTVQRYNTYLKLLFTVDAGADLRNELNRCNIPEKLRDAFKNCDTTSKLSFCAIASVEEKNNKWRIVDDPYIYKIVNNGGQMNVYRAGAPTVYIKNIADKLRSLKNPMLFPMLFAILLDNRHEKLADKIEKVYNNSQSITLGSPAEIRVYDSSGRITGSLAYKDRKNPDIFVYDSKDEIREDIPNSIYDHESKTIILLLSTDTYRYEVVGTGEGTYNLDITSIKHGDFTLFSAFNIPIKLKEVHRYIIDWGIISDNKGVKIDIDKNGDGIFDESIEAGKRFIYIDRNLNL
ncbi:MAG: peptidoglycan-binding protein [bacterium]